MTADTRAPRSEERVVVGEVSPVVSQTSGTPQLEVSPQVSQLIF